MNAIRQAVEDYVAMRRTLGFRMAAAGICLPQFALFLKQQGAAHITVDLALRWAKQPANVQANWWALRLGMVRRFAQYYSAMDSRTEIPPSWMLRYRCSRATPHIYTSVEIHRLMEAARKLPSKIGMKPHTYSTLFGLLAVTGMRISESINLHLEDVDLKHGVLTIQQTKFGKSRLIALHPITQRALQRYLHRKNHILPQPKTASFFVSDHGMPLNDATVERIFNQLSCQIGLREPQDSRGPRLHDFRHTFAVRTLIRWYRRGADVEREMPKLSTYLGHAHVTYTYWYITAIPELLRLAITRMKHLHRGFFS